MPALVRSTWQHLWRETSPQKTQTRHIKQMHAGPAMDPTSKSIELNKLKRHSGVRLHSFSLQGPHKLGGWGEEQAWGVAPWQAGRHSRAQRDWVWMAPRSRNKSPTKPPRTFLGWPDPPDAPGRSRTFWGLCEAGGRRYVSPKPFQYKGWAPSPLDTHDAAVFLVVHLLHLQAV